VRNRVLPILVLLLTGVMSTPCPAGAVEDRQSTATAQPAAPVESALSVPRDWILEKTGQFLPLQATFFDEQGRKVVLGELIDQPTLLLPVYYTCPSLCSFDLANLAETLRRLDSLGEKGFRVLALSFNTEDTPAIARATKPNYTHLLDAGFSEERWRFLTGDEANIMQVTEAIGYRFQRQRDGVFIHPSALVAIDRNGQIIKYIYGSFIPGDVALALKEAAESRPATSIRRLLAFCFPANPRQDAVVLNIMKIASLAVLVAGAIWLAFLLRRKKTSP